MKIAVLGDIHGNIEALRVAYDVARQWGPDRVIHLGDLGGYAPGVNEVVEFVKAHAIEGVQGNYDLSVGAGAEHCGCKYEDPAQAELADRSFRWTKAHATAESKAYMIALPSAIRLEAGGLRAAVFHAAPHKNNLYWYEDRQDKFFAEMAEKTGADLMVYGHTHKAYRKDMGGRVFINAGSVGKPKDGDPRTCVALISIEGGAVHSEFRRAPYDIEKTARAIIESGLPPEFAEALRRAL